MRARGVVVTSVAALVAVSLGGCGGSSGTEPTAGPTAAATATATVTAEVSDGGDRESGGASGGEFGEDDVAKWLAEAPACDDVWVVGQTLPDDYDGCVENEDTVVPSMSYDCDTGPDLVPGPDEPGGMFALLGNTIVGGGTSSGRYADLFALCRP